MLVNPISASLNLHARNQISAQNMPVIKPIMTPAIDTVSFTGVNHETIKRNQLKILLTQDIWAARLNVKMPENELEKEVLLEILEQRQKLDRYARLNNERFELGWKTSYLAELLDTDPTNPNVEILANELKRYGNIPSTLKTMDRDIQIEKKKHQNAFDYFKQIEELENEYMEKRLVRPAMITKFYEQVNKHNINKDGQYSTRELIQIISKGQQPVLKSQTTQKTPVSQLSKKEVLAEAKKLYELSLRENINIYGTKLNHYSDARDSQKIVNDFYASAIKRYPDLSKMLAKTYKATEATFKHKVDRLIDVDIYPIGEIWDDMKGVEDTMSATFDRIDKLNIQLETSSNKYDVQTELDAEQAILDEAKEDWIKGVKYSLKYEDINAKRMKDAGRAAEYEYLTGANKILRRHKAAYKIYTLNNDNIPEPMWKQVLFGKVEDLEKYVSELEG